MADPIYPPISMMLYMPPAVVARPLPFALISMDITLHPVMTAKKECPNSCKNVTIRFIG